LTLLWQCGEQRSYNPSIDPPARSFTDEAFEFKQTTATHDETIFNYKVEVHENCKKASVVQVHGERNLNNYGGKGIEIYSTPDWPFGIVQIRVLHRQSILSSRN
jgi:hypothetical protein